MAQALVQSAGSANSLATQPQAYGSNVTAGNLLVVLGELQGASTTCTSMVISDTIGNIWTPVWGSIQSPAGGTIAKFIQAWFCINKTTGANTVTNTTNGASIGQNALAIQEYSGFGLAILDQLLAAAAANSTAVLGLSFTTTRTNSIIFGFTDINANQTAVPTINAPFSRDTDLTTGVAKNAVSVHAIAATIGSYALAGTWDTGTGNTRISAGFSVSASANISGNAGVVGATVSYSGTASGSVIADGSGNYVITGLAPGPYTITPSLTGWAFSPTSSNQTITTADIAGVNFVATRQVTTPYSVPDCRVAPFGPNANRNVNNTLIYDVQTSSNPAIAPTDSRATKPIASGIYPQNSRTPGTFGPGE